MRRATAATHSGASRSISTPGSFSRMRARRGCAMRASPIQLGATTRMRGKRLVTFYACALIDVLRPAVRAEHFALLGDVEEHARMARPERSSRQRAMQWQVLLRHLDQAGVVGAHRFFAATGVSQWRCLSSLPFTTSKNAFWIAWVTGPAWPVLVVWPFSPGSGVTSAAVPVKKHSSAM